MLAYRTEHFITKTAAWGVAALSLGVAIAVGCSAGGDPDGPNAAAVGGTGATSSSGGRTTATGGTIVLIDASEPDVVDPDAALRCGAIRMASLGGLAYYGANQSDSTQAFIDWLNNNSSAEVALFETKTEPITLEFLSTYNVVILQDMAAWSFSAEEVAAFQTWLSDLGGGLITMTGYSADVNEVVAANQFLGVAGLAYNQDDILGEGDCSWGNCYCTDSSVPILNWVPDHPTTANITALGAFHGRSITVQPDANATVVATHNELNAAVASEVGTGRVFAFADEWVTYTSQWISPLSRRPEWGDPYDPCYQKTADVVYQTGQFWYNVIKWVSQCEDFVITDPEVEIIY